MADAAKPASSWQRFGEAGLWTGLLAVLPLACILFSLTLGTYDISVPDVFAIIWCKITGRPFEGSAMAANLVWQVRMPRVLSAALVGAALSVSGAIFQGVFRNQPASPYTLGRGV